MFPRASLFFVFLGQFHVFSAVNDTTSHLKAWILQHDGAFVHPLLETRTDANGAKGLFVAGDIPYGERLLEVPWAAIISGASALTSAGLPAGLLTLIGQITEIHKGVDPHLLALALQVLRARRGQGAMSPELQPFIESLPSDAWATGMAEQGTGPVSLWLEEFAVDRCFVALGPLEDELRVERKRWQSIMNSLAANWTAATHEADVPSRESLSWALAVASTRTFGAKWSTIRLSQNSILQKRWGKQTLSDVNVAPIENRNGNMFSPLMVPFADFMNHALPPTASYDFMVGRGLVVSALRKDEKMPARSGEILPNISLQAGSEVLISYGMHDNEHLFKSYGFVIPNNAVRGKLRIPVRSGDSEKSCSVKDPQSSCEVAEFDGIRDRPRNLVWMQGPKCGGQLPTREHFTELLLQLNNRSATHEWNADITLNLADALNLALSTLTETKQAAPTVCAAFGDSTIAQLEGSLLKFIEHLAELSGITLPPSFPRDASLRDNNDDATWRALFRSWLRYFGHGTLDVNSMRSASAIDARSSSVLADALLERTEFESMQRSWMGSQL